MNSGHRVYPGSGHLEVNSPTSCFACITSLSGVVTVWWKKVQRELDSILLSSDVLVSTSSLQGALPTPFIEGAKLAAEASRFARGSSGNLTPRWSRGTHLGRLARRALAGAAWHAACLVHPLTCLYSEQAKCGTACAMWACLGSLRIPLRWNVHPVPGHLMLADIPSRCGTVWRHML